MKKGNKLYWKICIALVIGIVAIAYTPLLIPEGKYRPMILGVPFSLAVGFLSTVLLVVITFIGSRVHPGSDGKEVDQ